MSIESSSRRGEVSTSKRQVSGALGGVLSESTPYLGFNSPTSQFTITTSALYGADGNSKTHKASAKAGGKITNSYSEGKSNSSPNDMGNIQRNKVLLTQQSSTKLGLGKRQTSHQRNESSGTSGSHLTVNQTSTLQPRSMLEKMQTGAQKLSEKKLRFKNRLMNLGKMDFSSTVAMNQKDSKCFNPGQMRGMKGAGANVDIELYNRQNCMMEPLLCRMSYDVQKVTNDNINKIKLDKDLSSFKSVGPVFEGMPFVTFEEKPIDWSNLSKEVLSHFAPHFPFRYFSEEKDTAYSHFADEMNKYMKKREMGGDALGYGTLGVLLLKQNRDLKTTQFSTQKKATPRKSIHAINNQFLQMPKSSAGYQQLVQGEYFNKRTSQKSPPQGSSPSKLQQSYSQHNLLKNNAGSLFQPQQPQMMKNSSHSSQNVLQFQSRAALNQKASQISSNQSPNHSPSRLKAEGSGQKVSWQISEQSNSNTSVFNQIASSASIMKNVFSPLSQQSGQILRKQTLSSNMKFAKVKQPSYDQEQANSIRLRLFNKYTSDIGLGADMSSNKKPGAGVRGHEGGDSFEAEEREFFFLSMKQFLQFQARRKSCHCTRCGGEMKNENLRKKSEYIDAEVALINQLHKVKQQKELFKNYLIKDVTKKVREYAQYKEVRDQLRVLSKEEILKQKFNKVMGITSRRGSRHQAGTPNHKGESGSRHALSSQANTQRGPNIHVQDSGLKGDDQQQLRVLVKNKNEFEVGLPVETVCEEQEDGEGAGDGFISGLESRKSRQNSQKVLSPNDKHQRSSNIEQVKQQKLSYNQVESPARSPQKRILTEPMLILNSGSHIEDVDNLVAQRRTSGAVSIKDTVSSQRQTQSLSPRIELMKTKTIIIRESLKEYNQKMSPQMNLIAAAAGATSSKKATPFFSFKEALQEAQSSFPYQEGKYQGNNFGKGRSNSQKRDGQVNANANQVVEFDIDDAHDEDEDLNLQELKPYLLDLKAKHQHISVGVFPQTVKNSSGISKATESIVNVIQISNQFSATPVLSQTQSYPVLSNPFDGSTTPLEDSTQVRLDQNQGQPLPNLGKNISVKDMINVTNLDQAPSGINQAQRQSVKGNRPAGRRSIFQPKSLHGSGNDSNNPISPNAQGEFKTSRLQQIELTILRELENQKEEYKNFIHDEIERNIKNLSKEQLQASNSRPNGKEKRQQFLRLGAGNTIAPSNSGLMSGSQVQGISSGQSPGKHPQVFSGSQFGMLSHLKTIEVSTPTAHDQELQQFKAISKFAPKNPQIQEQPHPSKSVSKLETGSSQRSERGQGGNTESQSESVSAVSSRDTDEMAVYEAQRRKEYELTVKATKYLTEKMYKKPKDRTFLKELKLSERTTASIHNLNSYAQNINKDLISTGNFNQNNHVTTSTIVNTLPSSPSDYYQKGFLQKRTDSQTKKGKESSKRLNTQLAKMLSPNQKEKNIASQMIHPIIASTLPQLSELKDGIQWLKGQNQCSDSNLSGGNSIIYSQNPYFQKFGKPKVQLIDPSSKCKTSKREMSKTKSLQNFSQEGLNSALSNYLRNQSPKVKHDFKSRMNQFSTMTSSHPKPIFSGQRNSLLGQKQLPQSQIQQSNQLGQINSHLNQDSEIKVIDEREAVLLSEYFQINEKREQNNISIPQQNL